MSTLVVFAGTHATGWPEVRHRFGEWAPTLRASGVVLPGAADKVPGAAAWRRYVDSEDDGSLAASCRAALADGAETFVTGSEELEDALRDPAHVQHLERLARDVGMTLLVVVVLRDQVGYLNDLYCERVMQLATAKDFASFVAEPQPVERFDYETAFDALLSAQATQVTILPYVDDAGRQAAELLSAAGVARGLLDALPSQAIAPKRLGPYTVAAIRLLHKRFRRNGLMHKVPRRRLVDAAKQLAEDALLAGWDDTSFWGWSPVQRAEAIARFRPGNDRLAQAVWGREWGDDWADGEPTDVDLASSEPSLVAGLLEAVDAYVQDLRESGDESSSSAYPGEDE